MCALDIAITGMGGVCAMGSCVQAIRENLNCPQAHRKDASLLGQTALSYPFFAVPPGILADTERADSRATLHLALHALREACTQAQFSSSPQCPTGPVGIVMGTTAGSALHFLNGYAAQRQGKTASFEDVDAYLASNLALELAQILQIQGPALTIANACTSGADALGMAADMIRTGQCDYMICGGADALSIVPHTGFIRLMIYDDQACRPFDAQRKGLNLGEGAACFVLETAARAKVRSVPVRGYIRGYGAASDAHHFTAPHPEGRGLVQAIEQALQQAEISADDLAFINVHGTATLENDKVEGGVIRQLFPHIPVWASKGSTGHTLGAAGSLEALLCLLALDQRCIPPSLGFSSPDPLIGVSPTQQVKPIRKNHALSLSLGFGGGNAALVVERSVHAQ